MSELLVGKEFLMNEIRKNKHYLESIKGEFVTLKMILIIIHILVITSRNAKKNWINYIHKEKH